PTRSTTSVVCPLRGRHICVPRSVCVDNFESLRSVRDIAAVRDVARTIGRSTQI
ncbi:Hypothetical protein FKW44_013368, partial [Caligus rogercresseyi]